MKAPALTQLEFSEEDFPKELGFLFVQDLEDMLIRDIKP